MTAGVLGLDCPGAVQFVPQGSDAYRDERLVAVSGAEIARRLATGRQDGAGWIANNETGGPPASGIRSRRVCPINTITGAVLGTSRSNRGLRA